MSMQGKLIRRDENRERELLNRDDIIQLTREVGGSWAVFHAHRLFVLAKDIGADLEFDPNDNDSITSIGSSIELGLWSQYNM
jgi:hypothetical protein